MPSTSIRHKLKQKRAFIIFNGPFADVSDGLCGCDVHAVNLGDFSVSTNVTREEERWKRGEGGKEKDKNKRAGRERGSRRERGGRRREGKRR